MNGSEYRHSTPPGDFEQRLATQEVEVEDLVRKVKGFEYDIEKYRLNGQATLWGIRWAKFGLIFLYWAGAVITLAIALNMKHCHEENTRIERAVDQCDCDYMKHTYERQYYRDKANAKKY